MPDDTPADAPKLHIDSDWKAEAQAEKERLAAAEAQREAERGPDGPGGQGAPLEANFTTLMGLLASQALMGLGTMVDPQTKGVVVDLEGSRLNIDLLGVLEEKTKGNLSDDEATELTQVLTELRHRYVQVMQLVAQQMAQGGPGAPGVDASAGPRAEPPPGPVQL